MMDYSIALKNLPFKPEIRQVIYVENEYDERINALIKDNYEWIKWACRKTDLEFVYLPLFFKDDEVREKVLYYAPYLTEEILMQTELHNSFLLNFMSHMEDREKILPSLFYAPIEDNGEWIFSCLTIDRDGQDKGGYDTDGQDADGQDNGSAIEIFSRLISEITEDIISETMLRKYRYEDDLELSSSLELECNVSSMEAYESTQVDGTSSESVWKKWKSLLKKNFHAPKAEKYEGGFAAQPYLDDIREDDVEDILKSLDESVQRLLLIGVPLGAIHELIDKRETVSRLCITEDLKIILPDYNDKEVKMTAQHKAIYLLFLFHPEGIILKRLEEYHNELVYFYKKTSKVEKLTPKMLESINKMESIGNNYLNTIFAKIRAAFVESFDKHLARHYIIQGRPGEPYRIPLDPELIIYEEDGD